MKCEHCGEEIVESKGLKYVHKTRMYEKDAGRCMLFAEPAQIHDPNEPDAEDGPWAEGWAERCGDLWRGIPVRVEPICAYQNCGQPIELRKGVWMHKRKSGWFSPCHNSPKQQATPRWWVALNDLTKPLVTPILSQLVGDGPEQLVDVFEFVRHRWLHVAPEHAQYRNPSPTVWYGRSEAGDKADIIAQDWQLDRLAIALLPGCECITSLDLVIDPDIGEFYDKQCPHCAGDGRYLAKEVA